VSFADSRSPEVALSVEGVSKRFRLYADRKTSLKEAFTVRRRRDRYKEFWALRDVSLDIPRGSTYALIGHNGSGKSTLLKLMAGIHRPTTGSIVSTGRISALLELGAGFHPELSGRDNIYLNGSILGMTRRQIDVALERIVDFSGLQDFIDTPVKVYSSGMYVRLGFSIAINLDPEILLIDEIIAVGDEEFQRRCFDHLYTLRRRGVTIVFVSHSLPLVQTLCDRAVWLDHGRIMREGSALEIADAYLAQVNAAERSRLHDDEADGDLELAEVGRRGTQEASVTGVEFLDDAGRPTLVATPGLPLTIRLHYRTSEAIDDPVFGVGFHTEAGVHLSGPNTKLAGRHIGRLCGAGYIDYRLDRLPFNPGQYLVSAAIVDDGMLHVFDYRDRAFALHVQPGRGSPPQGLLDLAGKWSGPAGGPALAVEQTPATTPGERSEMAG
jgi:lipopolysaccharide transport system ATP-binding protein